MVFAISTDYRLHNDAKLVSMLILYGYKIWIKNEHATHKVKMESRFLLNWSGSIIIWRYELTLLGLYLI